VVATPLSFSLYVLLSIQDQGSCSVLGIFSGIFSYFFSRNVTSTNDAIVSDLYVQYVKIAHRYYLLCDVIYHYVLNCMLNQMVHYNRDYRNCRGWQPLHPYSNIRR
jgi:hypothetical protein